MKTGGQTGPALPEGAAAEPIIAAPPWCSELEPIRRCFFDDQWRDAGACAPLHRHEVRVWGVADACGRTLNPMEGRTDRPAAQLTFSEVERMEGDPARRFATHAGRWLDVEGGRTLMALHVSGARPPALDAMIVAALAGGFGGHGGIRCYAEDGRDGDVVLVLPANRLMGTWPFQERTLSVLGTEATLRMQDDGFVPLTGRALTDRPFRSYDPQIERRTLAALLEALTGRDVPKEWTSFTRAR